jgi:hypothetical protein
VRPAFRLVLAFLFAPAAPLLVISLVDPLTMGRMSWESSGALMYTVCAYPVWLSFGIPLYHFAVHKGWLRWWQLIAQGCVLGVVAFPVVPEFLLLATGSSFPGVGSGRFGMTILGAGTNTWLELVAHGAAFGAMSGGLFALILRMPRELARAKAQ